MRRSKVRLNYHALDTALHDKKRKGRGYVDKVLVGSSAEVYRRYPDDGAIVLKLHATEILTFYPNGDKTINFGGWDTSITRAWIYQAIPVWFRRVKPNKWTEPITMYMGPYGTHCQYYDHMRVDSVGRHIGTRPLLTKNLLNEEAKALRKQVLQVYKERYLPHLNMLSTRDERVEKHGLGRGYDDLARVLGPDANEYEMATLGVMYAAGYYERWTAAPKLFMRWLDVLYENEVRRRSLFDVVPYEYQPKE